jgi:flagellar hook-associated protein 2
MALTVSGLSGSGIDVTSLVSQLMSAEQVPQQALINKKASALTTQTSWSSLNTVLAQVTDAVTNLNTSSAASAASVSSSNSALATVTSNGSASPQNLTFQISQLATAQQLTSTTVASTGTPVGAGTMLLTANTGEVGISGMSVDNSVLADGRHNLTVQVGASSGGTAQVNLDGTNYNVTMDGNPVTIGGLTFNPGSSLNSGSVDFTSVTTSSTDTLTDLAGKINTFGGPASAGALNIGNSAGAKLVLTAGNTGLQGAVTVTGTGALSSLASGLTTNRAPLNAIIQMGNLTVNRPSNTITDLIPGATIQLLKADPAGTAVGAGTDVTIGVQMDSSGVAKKAKALVDSLNSVFSTVGTLTSWDDTSKTGGPLFGDSRPKQLQNDLYSAMNSVLGTGTTKTLDQVGIQVQRDGTYTFDPAALATQLAADPQGALTMLSNAANAVAKVQQSATGTATSTGWISVAQTGAQQTVTDLQTQISSWNDKLALMQTRYTTQFTNLDVAVATLKNQGSWLTTQLASLAANSSG